MPASPSPAVAAWPAHAQALWQRLQAHEFDAAGAALPFTHRLARDNHWSLAYASRVVTEYRRFCFLACVQKEQEVTPSDQIDQVWHLHLLYTRDYWQRWCTQVLGRELHHGPTLGGADEGVRFDEQYANTRHAYLRWFGEHPPADIWPGAAERFGRDTRWLRVNREDYWLVRKPRRERRVPAARVACHSRPWLSVLGVLLLLLTIGGGSAEAAEAADTRPTSLAEADNDPYALAAGAFLQWYAWVCVGVLGAATVSRRLRSRARGRGRGLGQLDDDAYRAALLHGGERRVLVTALAQLMDRGQITVSRGGHIRPKDPPSAQAHALDRAIHESASEHGDFHGSALFRTQPIAVQRALDQIRGASEASGLLMRPQEQPMLEWLALAFPLLSAAPRLMDAVPAQRPVGFLISLLVIATVSGFFLLKHSTSPFTQGGRRLREHLKRKADRLAKRRDGAPSDGQALLLATAVYGGSALASTALADVRQALPRQRSSDSGAGGCSTDSGGSSGCGGGGCGGGGCGG